MLGKVSDPFKLDKVLLCLILYGLLLAVFSLTQFTDANRAPQNDVVLLTYDKVVLVHDKCFEARTADANIIISCLRIDLSQSEDLSLEEYARFQLRAMNAYRNIYVRPPERR